MVEDVCERVDRHIDMPPLDPDTPPQILQRGPIPWGWFLLQSMDVDTIQCIHGIGALRSEARPQMPEPPGIIDLEPGLLPQFLPACLTQRETVPSPPGYYRKAGAPLPARNNLISKENLNDAVLYSPRKQSDYETPASNLVGVVVSLYPSGPVRDLPKLEPLVAVEYFIHFSSP